MHPKVIMDMCVLIQLPNRYDIKKNGDYGMHCDSEMLKSILGYSVFLTIFWVWGRGLVLSLCLSFKSSVTSSLLTS